jgi:hypothetical protein
MEKNMNELLDDNLINKPFTRRREILPTWIKVFCWIFMIMGIFAPIGLLLGIFGINFQFAFYGMETNEPISIIGIILITLFLLKGISAFGLWTEKDWAIKVGLIDAIIGILVCIYIMLIYPFIDDKPGFTLSLRLELILLIPYFLKLNKIKNDWENN